MLCLKWCMHAIQDDFPVSNEIRRGRQAYTLKQAMYRDRIRLAFESLWGRRENWEDKDMDVRVELLSSKNESNTPEETGGAMVEPQLSVSCVVDKDT